MNEYYNIAQYYNQLVPVYALRKSKLQLDDCNILFIIRLYSTVYYKIKSLLLFLFKINTF